MTTTAILCLAIGLSPSDSLAQQKSLKEQLVGTWTLVSSDQVRPDGSTLKQFGTNPKGINVFDTSDRFFLMIASADNSKIVSNTLSKTNSEEGGGLIVESDRVLRHVHRQRGREGCDPSYRGQHIPEPGRNRSKTNYHVSNGGRAEAPHPWCDVWCPSPSSMEASRVVRGSVLGLESEPTVSPWLGPVVGTRLPLSRCPRNGAIDPAARPIDVIQPLRRGDQILLRVRPKRKRPETGALPKIQPGQMLRRRPWSA